MFAEGIRLIATALGVAADVAAAVVGYLERHGYLPSNSAVDLAADRLPVAFRTALSALQSRAGQPPTGELTGPTLRLLSVPRCGCPDHRPAGDASTAAVRWPRRDLTWWVASYVEGVELSRQEEIFLAAWRSWEAVADLHLRRVARREEADLILGSGRGPAQGMDGRGGTLAWAYLPTADGRPIGMRFDLDESWLLEPGRPGTLLLNVAAHEFGHLLGLEHSTVPGALMYPWYSPLVSSPQLSDDVPRVQALYGPPRTPPTPSPPEGHGRIVLEVEGTVRSARVLEAA